MALNQDVEKWTPETISDWLESLGAPVQRLRRLFWVSTIRNLCYCFVPSGDHEAFSKKLLSGFLLRASASLEFELSLYQLKPFLFLF